MTVLERAHAMAPAHYARVVLPVDFSPLSWRALPLARQVAARFGAGLEPIYVDVGSPWRESDGSRLTLTTAPFGKRLEVAVVAAADPAKGILGYAAADPSTLLAMATHAHTGFAEMAVGSVCEAVLRRFEGPVLAVGPEFDIGRHSIVHRLVVCIDGSSDSLAVVPDALSWARALDVPLELMTVLPGHRAADLSPEREAAAEMERLARDLVASHERVSSLVLHGARAGFEIVRYADSLPGTLIAMSTHARPAVARAIVGSVVMHVARHTPTGLLLRRRPRADDADAAPG